MVIVVLLLALLVVCSSEWTDYLGVAVSTQYQETPVSNGKVAATLNNFPFSNFKFYTGYHENETAYEILQYIPDAKLYIQIQNSDVESLSTDIIEDLLSEYESMKSNVAFIQLGNEPEYNSIVFRSLPKGIRLLYETLENTGDSDWQNVDISIPFSASLFYSSYPVSSGSFQEPYNGSAATFTNGVCDNCQECDNTGVLYEILNLYLQHGSSLFINLYPFFSCLYESSSLYDYCVGNEGSNGGDSGHYYQGMLEAQYQAARYAMANLVGWDNASMIDITITETGWPSNGTSNNGVYIGNKDYGYDYFSNLFKMMQNESNYLYQANIFVFELFDEYNKINYFNWEQYWGIIDNNGCGKYDLTEINLNTGYYAGGTTNGSQCNPDYTNNGINDDTTSTIKPENGTGDGGDTDTDTGKAFVCKINFSILFISIVSFYLL